MNHGSFGACPIPVLEECQRWQRELERHPVKYLGREFNALLGESRRVLAEYLNCPPEDVVYFTNPTTAINMVARSLNLQSGDEILATNHEYGATNRTWRFVAEKMGARYINQPIQVPFGDKAEVVEQFWRGATKRTKAIFCSHITSQTALHFPIRELCREAKKRGIISIIDGAHAPGHIPVDLVDLGADIYTGACHKWLCAPKGAAFLYVAKHLQAAMNPLVVSWGYEAEIPGESQYLDYHEWQGTRDISAFLTVPVAINLVTRPAWQQSQVECRRMASRWWRTLQSVHGLLPLSSTDSWFGQMFALQIPGTDVEPLKSRLYNDFKVEVPIYTWEGQTYLRVSVQVYNQPADFDALSSGLEAPLP